MINKDLFNGKMYAAGYRQKTLASKVNISKNTLCAKINGKSPMNTELIDKLCTVLNITSDAEKIQIFLQNPSHIRDDKKERET